MGLRVPRALASDELADVPEAAGNHGAISNDSTPADSQSQSGPGRGRGRGHGRGRGRGRGNVATSRRSPHARPQEAPPPPREAPPYASAMTFTYAWPRLQHSDRPGFLADYPVPDGKTFNVNSFLGRIEPHGGKYLVPQSSYRLFLESYVKALEDGYQLYLTENYHQQVYKYFVELDWEWDTDQTLVMEVTPQLIALISSVAGDFYALPYPNAILSIRTPFKVHLNFPQLLTTELLACVCRDRILDACRSRLAAYNVDWERLIDFPHGSLRLMGSRKAPHMDSDPAWVQDKAYHPARLVDGKWLPGRITAPLLQAASIFPQPHQVAAFERSPKYLDMVFSDMEAYRQKLEERRLRREMRAASGGPATNRGPAPNLPPGSSKLPLYVTLAVREDETVALNVHVKSRYRTRGRQAYRDSSGDAQRAAAGTGAAPDHAGGAGSVAEAEHAATATAEDGAASARPAAAGSSEALVEAQTMPSALGLEHAAIEGRGADGAGAPSGEGPSGRQSGSTDEKGVHLAVVS